MTDTNAGRRHETVSDESGGVPVASMDVAPELFPASADDGGDAAPAQARDESGRSEP